MKKQKSSKTNFLTDVPDMRKQLEKKPSEKFKGLIEREKEIWKTAYPKQAKVIEKFANKIWFELSNRINEDTEKYVKLRVDKIFEEIEKLGKYKVDRRSFGQGMLITLGETRWKKLKKKFGIK